MVSIIIVNHNTGKILEQCVKSVFQYENSSSKEIIIIDNFSADNSKDIIREISGKYPGIKSVILEKLESFSAANNRGIKMAAGDFILIMNPDIIFTEPLLDKLIAISNNNKNIGAVTPALIGANGKFQRNYFQRYPSLIQFILFYSFWAKIFYRFGGLMNKYLENQDIDMSSKELQYVEQIPCAFFFASKEILNQTGLMDENFDLFFEDVDLSYEINKKYKLAVDARIKVTHLGGESFKTEDSWQFYGRFISSMHYFFKKHYSFISSALLKFFAVTNSLTVLLLEYIKRIFGKADIYRIKKHKNLLKLLKK